MNVFRIFKPFPLGIFVCIIFVYEGNFLYKYISLYHFFDKNIFRYSFVSFFFVIRIYLDIFVHIKFLYSSHSDLAHVIVCPM